MGDFNPKVPSGAREFIVMKHLLVHIILYVYISMDARAHIGFMWCLVQGAERIHSIFGAASFTGAEPSSYR
jgi:hypothetical protein